MSESNKTEFTREMIKDYTILIPNMLPIHFKFMLSFFTGCGYHVELLETEGREIVDEGLKNVHNDTCYPALLVIGQFIHALKSGKYDVNKVALMITQTGGGCRASNYIHLLRKALSNSGYGQVPVISMNVGGLEKHSGFSLTPSLLLKILNGVYFGDLLMLLSNQCKPYERASGETARLTAEWTERLSGMMRSKSVFSSQLIIKLYGEIIDSYAAIPVTGAEKFRVGIVGEIYVKYSPLGNNNMEEFLLSEGAEVVVPGLADFAMYCCYNGIMDRKLYGKGKGKWLGFLLAYRILLHKQKQIIRAISRSKRFSPPAYFETTREMAKEYIGLGVKMGEGWLLTAEMVELLHQGVGNIICAQPFGCLPNHIVARGMMRKILKKNPQANIVSIDFDPGATKINQENRIKLMLSHVKQADGENISTEHEQALV